MRPVNVNPKRYAIVPYKQYTLLFILVIVRLPNRSRLDAPNLKGRSCL